MIEESKVKARILVAFNATFIALIPKQDNPTSLDQYMPISLCNCIYKLSANIIDNRIKGVLSKVVSAEQFAFLEKRQIHDDVGIAQEVV